jgi:hypothetical protein
MNQNLKNLAVTVARGAARLLVVGVALLWGAFFVAHTAEWFIKPFPQLPPLKVCVFQALHLLLLAGLLVSLRWPRIGLVWVAVSALVFFLPVKGANYPLFAGLTILPVLLLALLDRPKRTDTTRMLIAQ